MFTQAQRILSACVMLFTVMGMTARQVHAETTKQLRVSENVQALSESINHFAFDIYAQLAKTQSGNLFFSPTSIATALAMTYAGAEGVTERELAKTLRLSLPADRVHNAFASLTAKLNTSQQDAYELRVANRLWGQKGYGFLPEFLSITSSDYGAKLAEVDFVRDVETARSEINAWVEEQTNDRIKNLIPQGMLDSLTRLVLTNAIYFKGKWEQEFDTKVTKDSPFTVSAGKNVTVAMMYQKKRFRYGETDALQLLEMPYKGNELSMLVLLPKKMDGLSELEKRLSAERINTWLRGMRSVEVQTYFPRFELSGQFQLNSILAALGMPSAFDPRMADFSAMNGKRDLFISAALHKSFVNVNEEGTEAAAATGVIMSRASAPVKPKVFRADHPFIFVIRDRRSGGMLFLGRLVNPQE